MTKKYILLIVVFVTFLFSSTLLKYENEIIIADVKQVFSNSTLGNTKLKKVNNEDELYSCEIYYPETKYENLNKYINNSINDVKKSFLEEINKLGIFPNGKKYKLNITFNQYEYKTYMSFSFDVLIDLCGAHPYNYIFTINYDTKKNNVITVNDFIKKDKEFLNKLSNKTYEVLKDNSAIKAYSKEEDLKEGLKPTISNFENIIFDNDKLIVFINIYQVAPYVAGNFEVAIPYSEIL